MTCLFPRFILVDLPRRFGIGFDGRSFEDLAECVPYGVICFIMLQERARSGIICLLVIRDLERLDPTMQCLSVSDDRCTGTIDSLQIPG